MAFRHGKKIRNSQSVVIFGYDFPVNVAERTTFGFAHAFTLTSMHRRVQNRRRNYARERAVAQTNPDDTRILNPRVVSSTREHKRISLLCDWVIVCDSIPSALGYPTVRYRKRILATY